MSMDLDFDEDTAYAWYEYGEVYVLHLHHKGMLCTRKPVLLEKLPDELREDGAASASGDNGAVENAFADIHPIVQRLHTRLQRRHFRS